MQKSSSAILLSLFIIHYSFFIAFAQSNPLVESGKAKQKEGNHDQAIVDFTSAIKQNQSQVEKHLNQKEDAPPLDANLALPYYLRGYSYSVTGNNNNAMADFNTAIKINPALGSAYYERGKLLWTIGKKDEGCIDLGIAGSLKDSSARELFDEKFCWKEAVLAYNDASSKVRLNDFAGAFDQIQKAIKVCPDSANYLGLRGRAYLGLGKYELAMQDFDKAISLSPNSVDAWFGRGVAQYSKSNWQEAFDDLSKAIQLNDRIAEIYLYRAYTCEGMDKNQSALYDYQQVQRLKPGETLAFFKCGLLRNSMGDIKGACNDFKRAANMGHTEAQDYAEKCDKMKTK